MSYARVAPGPPPERWSVAVPGSKSLTNRALLVAGVAAGTSRLRRPLAADDTTAMADVLRALGASIASDGEDLLVGGLGAPPTRSGALYCGMGATVGRFLLPMLAAGEGHFDVDAHPQLRRRPIGPILAALAAQGAAIEGDAFPLSIDAHGLAGGEVRVDASVSSQFLSGLLLAAPLAQSPTTLHFGTLASAPYLRLTLDVMAAFGAAPTVTDAGTDGAPGARDARISVEPTGYRAADYVIEPDASTASYFLAAAALTASTVTLPGLQREHTHQGDIALIDHLVAMGAEASGESLRGPAQLHGVHVDMSQASDVFMTLACVAPFADSPTTIEGLAHVRVKESDRLAATAENLRRLGVAVDEGPDFLRVVPDPDRPPRPGVRLPTYEDHRIAMAFALIGLRVPVELDEPGVVAKTCPTFWELWPATGAEVTLW